MKFRELHLKVEKEEQLKIQCSKDCSPRPQQGQYRGQSLVTLPDLIAMTVLYLNPQRRRIIQEKPRLN